MFGLPSKDCVGKKKNRRYSSLAAPLHVGAVCAMLPTHSRKLDILVRIYIYNVKVYGCDANKKRFPFFENRDSGDDECALHLAAGIGMKKNVSCEGEGEINKKVTQHSAV